MAGNRKDTRAPRGSLHPLPGETAGQHLWRLVEQLQGESFIGDDVKDLDGPTVVRIARGLLAYTRALEARLRGFLNLWEATHGR